ncbi:MAG: alkaline phosphatase family protein [Treponema sp.]|nr:alkaline phosphatase family protein [Treponema sp.]
MLIISYDAIGDKQFDRLLQYPVFNAFAKQCAVFRDVSTIFISNTYPVHTSVATGVLPCEHGITSNAEAFPSPNQLWNFDEALIRVKTIWQLASKKGIKTAAVLWPVTGFSKSINYNIPEVRAMPGKSQLLTSLKAGSPFLQFKMYLRHRSLLNGIKQPNLDFFSTACMVDILREKKPGLSLVHLTAYDFICHDNGLDSAALDAAYDAMDKNLAALLAAADGDDIVLFSDHSQININKVIDPNSALAGMGLINQTDNGYLPGENNCFAECGGGSAFFHAGKLTNDKINEIRSMFSSSEGFRRFLTNDELRETGRENAAFGFCAKAGFCYEIFGTKKKGNHGYPLDMPDYKVFYMTRGCGQKPGINHGGSLLDIAPLVIRHLGL